MSRVADLQAALGEVRARGATLVPEAVAPPFLDELQREAEHAPLAGWPEQIGSVRQKMDGCFLHPPFDGFPCIVSLAEALTEAARASGVRGLATWRPNEVSVQRYRPGPLGIEPHRDNLRYRGLVAIFTTKGCARFRVLEAREGGVLAEWTPHPGDLVLLRGPGLAGVRDGRPFHAIDAPERGQRWSVSFRQNARPDEA